MSSQKRSVPVPLTQASSLPGHYLFDEEIYREECERIFYRSWLCVGRAEDFPNVGSFKLHEVGDESILVVKSGEQEINAFYNVCRHRGSRILEKRTGEVASIQCPYHSWTYSLAGRLVGAPHTDGLTDFDKRNYSLSPLRCESWAGFVFVNFDKAASPVKEHLKPLVAKCANLPLEALRR